MNRVGELQQQLFECEQRAIAFQHWLSPAERRAHEDAFRACQRETNDDLEVIEDTMRLPSTRVDFSPDSPEGRQRRLTGISTEWKPNEKTLARWEKVASL
jgi:hypothetical protein